MAVKEKNEADECLNEIGQSKPSLREIKAMIAHLMPTLYRDLERVNDLAGKVDQAEKIEEEADNFYAFATRLRRLSVPIEYHHERMSEPRGDGSHVRFHDWLYTDGSEVLVFFDSSLDFRPGGLCIVALADWVGEEIKD